MPLTMLSPGQTMSIKCIRGKDETKRHLENLGFTVGGAVTVISDLGGNVILCVKDTRVALNKAMAERIIV